MKIVKFNEQTELNVKNIKGFMKRKVVISGTSAKVTCPKEFLGSDAILIILENEHKKRGNSVKRRKQTT
ncbi:MAG: DUF2080 family transposase-associated protein [Elusimicrobiota bacterium]